MPASCHRRSAGPARTCHPTRRGRRRCRRRERVRRGRCGWQASLVDRHVRPIYERTTELFESPARAGAVPNVAPEHLYYILTGAGPTMFVLGPECRRLTSLDPTDDAVIEAHADAVCLLLFGSP